MRFMSAYASVYMSPDRLQDSFSFGLVEKTDYEPTGSAAKQEMRRKQLSAVSWEHY